MDATLVHTSRMARGSPQYKGGYSGSCSSFPAEMFVVLGLTYCDNVMSLVAERFGAFGSSHFSRLDKAFKVQSTVTRVM